MQVSDPDVTRPPAARLVALTNEARLALGGRYELPIEHFPFRLGRESRVEVVKDAVEHDRRVGTTRQLNDAYLLEPPWADFLHISREHFAIEYSAPNFFLVDRGSACGTIVRGETVGGDRRGGRVRLLSGDQIIVGTVHSPYGFRFELAE